MNHRRLGGAAAAGSAGYLIGTFPSADLATRLAGRTNIDLRTAGTGNPGGANAAAVLGKRWGYGVMVADIAKGALAAGAGARIFGGAGSHIGATASVIGHCYPATNGFRGGKGVATSIGQCLTTFPIYFPLDLVIGVTAAGKSTSPHRSFHATALGIAAWVGLGWLAAEKQAPNLWGPPPTKALPIANAVSGAVILRRFWEDRQKVAKASNDNAKPSPESRSAPERTP